MNFLYASTHTWQCTSPFWQTDILADLYKPQNSKVWHRLRYTIASLIEYSVVACVTHSIAHALWHRSVQAAMSHDKKKFWYLKKRASLYGFNNIFRCHFESLCWGGGEGQLMTRPFWRDTRDGQTHPTHRIQSRDKSHLWVYKPLSAKNYT